MKNPTNVGASVRQKLLTYSRARGDDHTLVLTRYAIERLLYRLSRSPHRDRFVLKGAALYAVWHRESGAVNYRPTRDLDFWSSGAPDVETVANVLRQIVATPVENDGLVFDSGTIKGDVKRADEEYQGCSFEVCATLDGIRIRVLMDFGFGDTITPAVQVVDYPTILKTLPAPNLFIYPRESVIAEKFEAMVSLDLTNSRLKDFYDIWMLSQSFDFDGPTLSGAIQRTFKRRQTALPDEIPAALTEKFGLDAAKMAQWKSFNRRIRTRDMPILVEVTEELQRFLWPVAQGALQEGFAKQWTPQIGWH